MEKKTVAVGQRWTRKDPESDRVVTFTVRSIDRLSGKVRGVTDGRKNLVAFRRAMLREDRYQLVQDVTDESLRTVGCRVCGAHVADHRWTRGLCLAHYERAS